MTITIPDYFREDLLTMLESKYTELRHDEDLYVHKYQQAKRQRDAEDYAEILERIRDNYFELQQIIKQLDNE